MGDDVHETGRAATAFAAYCALGPARSLAKLAELWGKSGAYVGQLERWSSKFRWVERATAYDKEQATLKLHRAQAALDTMNERHAEMGATQQSRAIKQIETLINAKSFGAYASVQLLKLAIDVERVARGAATSQIALTGKDGGPIEAEVIVETHWGRGTDPRKASADEDAQEEGASGEEEPEISVEFGTEE